jgi:hypothetical protein
VPSTVKVTAGGPPPHSGYSPFLFSVLTPTLSRLKREDQRPSWPSSIEDTSLMTGRSLFQQTLFQQTIPTRSGIMLASSHCKEGNNFIQRMLVFLGLPFPRTYLGFCPARLDPQPTSAVTTLRIHPCRLSVVFGKIEKSVARKMWVLSSTSSVYSFGNEK